MGFDQQIDLGTSTLNKWYQDAVDNYTFPYYYSNTGFRGYKGYGSTGYSTAIWCDNAVSIHHIRVAVMIVLILETFYFWKFIMGKCYPISRRKGDNCAKKIFYSFRKVS